MTQHWVIIHSVEQRKWALECSVLYPPFSWNSPTKCFTLHFCQKSFEHFSRSVVEHPSGLGQMWDKPIYIFIYMHMHVFWDYLLLLSLGSLSFLSGLSIILRLICTGCKDTKENNNSPEISIDRVFYCGFMNTQVCSNALLAFSIFVHLCKLFWMP